MRSAKCSVIGLLRIISLGQYWPVDDSHRHGPRSQLYSEITWTQMVCEFVINILFIVHVLNGDEPISAITFYCEQWKSQTVNTWELCMWYAYAVCQFHRSISIANLSIHCEIWKNKNRLPFAVSPKRSYEKMHRSRTRTDYGFTWVPHFHTNLLLFFSVCFAFYSLPQVYWPTAAIAQSARTIDKVIAEGNGMIWVNNDMIYGWIVHLLCVRMNYESGRNWKLEQFNFRYAETRPCVPCVCVWCKRNGNYIDFIESIGMYNANDTVERSKHSSII